MRKSLSTRLSARFRHHPAYTFLGRVLGIELCPSKWLFIVGCYNAGTTLLDTLLQKHHSIAGLEDEGVMLTNQLNRPEDFSWTRMWHICKDKVALKGEVGQKQQVEAIKKQWSLHYPHAGNLILLEKSIANTARIPFFATHFQPAYFIHIVRNGYAVAEGIRRKARPGNYGNPQYPDRYPLTMTARQWRVSLETVEREKPQLEHFCEIRYENLCERPLEKLNEIATFLDIPPFDPAWISGTFSIHNLESRILNQNTKSIARLTAEDRLEIEKEAGSWLRKLGYLEE